MAILQFDLISNTTEMPFEYAFETWSIDDRAVLIRMNTSLRLIDFAIDHAFWEYSWQSRSIADQPVRSPFPNGKENTSPELKYEKCGSTNQLRQQPVKPRRVPGAYPNAIVRQKCGTGE